MVGSIDPRCETVRGTHWPVKVAGVFGTRVAETILASGPPTASTGRTYGCKRSDQTRKLLWHGGRPHMGPGVRRDDELLFSRPIRPSFVLQLQEHRQRQTVDHFRFVERDKFRLVLDRIKQRGEHHLKAEANAPRLCRDPAAAHPRQ